MNDVEYAREVALGILADLKLIAGGWTVTDVVAAQDDPVTPRGGLSSGNHMLITISDPNGSDGFQVYFTASIDRAHASTATAEQLQDHAIERSHGDALPPCPDHPHPLQPHTVDGVPMWVCPRDPDHYRMPVSGPG